MSSARDFSVALMRVIAQSQPIADDLSGKRCETQRPSGVAAQQDGQPDRQSGRQGDASQDRCFLSKTDGQGSIIRDDAGHGGRFGKHHDRCKGLEATWGRCSSVEGKPLIQNRKADASANVFPKRRQEGRKTRARTASEHLTSFLRLRSFRK